MRYAQCCQHGYTELAVRADELTAPPSGITRAYVIENEITYLAFPLPPDAIVIFGGGYAVQTLESLNWLASLDLVYWGDLDTHGFAILNRLRHHFPGARSMLMDRATLLAHQHQWVTEPVPSTAALDLLAPAEQDLYRALGAGVFGPRFAWSRNGSASQPSRRLSSTAAATDSTSLSDGGPWSGGRTGRNRRRLPEPSAPAEIVTA